MNYGNNDYDRRVEQDYDHYSLNYNETYDARIQEKENACVWGPAQQEAFQHLKADMASEQVLALYDPEKETVASADASRFGLGAVLMKKQPSGEMRPVAYATRSMSETERSYAQVKKEALAFIWALEHLRYKQITSH